MRHKLLDTSTLSALMRGLPATIAAAESYLARKGHFTFSVITRYEILRGLKARKAEKQVHTFVQFCERNVLLNLDAKAVDTAADIYAALRERGTPIEDADILIAATALVNEMDLVTANVKHFARIPELVVESWR